MFSLSFFAAAGTHSVHTRLPFDQLPPGRQPARSPLERAPRSRFLFRNGKRIVGRFLAWLLLLPTDRTKGAGPRHHYFSPCFPTLATSSRSELPSRAASKTKLLSGEMKNPVQTKPRPPGDVRRHSSVERKKIHSIRPQLINSGGKSVQQKPPQRQQRQRRQQGSRGGSISPPRRQRFKKDWRLSTDRRITPPTTFSEQTFGPKTKSSQKPLP